MPSRGLSLNQTEIIRIKNSSIETPQTEMQREREREVEGDIQMIADQSSENVVTI